MDTTRDLIRTLLGVWGADHYIHRAGDYWWWNLYMSYVNQYASSQQCASGEQYTSGKQYVSGEQYAPGT